MRPIEDVARDLGLAPGQIEPWGPGLAKLRPEVAFGGEVPAGRRLVLVGALTPTPVGEGKTTMCIGLAQAARQRGVRAACALRQPSQGPVFGAKGGGTGGGRAALVPSDRINLHFTGDIHAVSAANNLLAALIDNEVYFRGPARIDPRQVTWRRALDMNDRFLRRTVIGLGGPAHGVPREDGFDITAASEAMAVLCLARDYADLRRRLGDMLVAFSSDGQPVHARDLKAEGAMAALLRDALLPNLVQTEEGAPALVHGGPFANIAHGCNSVVATRAALRAADLVFTEAGFGFDLGGEKFLDIKCRAAGLWPHAVVLVATLRALRYHGGVPMAEADQANPQALADGLANLVRQVENARAFGFEPLVAINVHGGRDAPAELERAVAMLRERNVEAVAADVFGRGGEGGLELFDRVLARAPGAPAQPQPKYLYELEASPAHKIEAIAKAMYGAASVEITPPARAHIDRAIQLGHGGLPICIAKTHLSLSDDEKQRGRPHEFVLAVREVRISSGAGFLVVLTGDVVTMPGLPRSPHASAIDLTAAGDIIGVG